MNTYYVHIRYKPEAEKEDKFTHVPAKTWTAALQLFYTDLDIESITILLIIKPDGNTIKDPQRPYGQYDVK